MKDSIKVILTVHFISLITIVLNIPIARQLFGFIYLSYIPGFLILKILKINLKDKFDEISFSLGISISFLMFIGLFMNELYRLPGIIRPLTNYSVISTLMFLTLALTLFYHKESLSLNTIDNYSHKVLSRFIYKGEQKVNFYLNYFLIFIPILSIFGAIFVNRIILLFVTILIIIYYIFIFFSKGLIPSNRYPVIIIFISFSLLFQTLLISNNFLGYDSNLEYYIFENTLMNGYWNNSLPENNIQVLNYNSMLSITILPVIYIFVLNIKSETLFMTLYVIIYAFIPIILYQIYKKQFDNKSSILSVLFFMANNNAFFGVQTLSHNRQNIGELFFTLIILLLITKEIGVKKKKLLLFLFGTSLIISHYAISYIFLLLIVYIFIFFHSKEKKKIFNKSSIMYFIIITIIWSVFISESLLVNLIHILKNVYSNFILDLFKLETRSVNLIKLINPTSNIIYQIHRILFVLVYLFIFVGVIKTIIKPRESKLNPMYRSMSYVSMLIVVMSIIIPNLAPSFNLDRIISINILILSPFFVLGANIIIKIIGKMINNNFYKNLEMNDENNNVNIKLVSIFMIIFFLFQIGFINNVLEDKPISFSLDLSRMKTSDNLEVKTYFYDAYIPEQDVFSAIWLSKNVKQTSYIYADRGSKAHVLASYGLFSQDQLYMLSRERAGILWNSSYFYWSRLKQWDYTYIYLRRLNVIEGLMRTWGESYNISEISLLIHQNNKIYSNGESEIYTHREKFN